MIAPMVQQETVIESWNVSLGKTITNHDHAAITRPNHPAELAPLLVAERQGPGNTGSRADRSFDFG
jgi:hypothetical protein